MPNRRLDAFANCGNSLWLRRDGDELVMTSNCCRDRLCQPCQTARRARLVEAILVRIAECESRVRFATFTLKCQPVPLTAQIDRLLASFKRLRETPLWKKNVPGGAFFLEVKLGAKSGLWHPHLHVLIEGSFIAQKSLCEAWHHITGDSYIVDVRAVPDPERRAGYVTKYATKPASGEVIANPARLDEFVNAIKGRRLYQPFGTWRKLNLDDDEGPRHLTTVGNMCDLHSRAMAGDPDARRWIEAAARKWPSVLTAFPIPPDSNADPGS